ncbi:MAG: DUF1801 domain-containing protein [Bacteroidota bacterium]
MHSIERYFDNLDDPKLAEIGRALHHLILSLIPQVEQSIKWSLPFYKYHGMLGYINPRQTHVNLCFTYGIHLSNEQGLLQVEGRKQIRCIHFHSIEEVYRETVSEVILEAALLNEQG